MMYDVAPESLGTLRRAAGASAGRVTLHVIRGDPASPLGDRLAAVAQRVEQRSDGGIPATFDVRGDSSGAPSLTVRVGGRDVVRYHAVPEGPEEGPFVAGLLACAGGPDSAADGPPPPPATGLTVFIAASCPNCPISVRAAIALAAASPGLTVAIVDVAVLPDLAERTGVRSVPTIVSDEGLTVVGAVSAAELAERLAAAAGPERDAAVLDSLLDAGRFAAAGELLASAQGHRRFLDRWRASGMEGRIGLVLAVDEALLRSAGALDPIVPDLVELTTGGESARRGDTADLLGRIGHPAARPALEALVSDPDEDVAEAAADALAAIEERSAAAPRSGPKLHG